MQCCNCKILEHTIPIFTTCVRSTRKVIIWHASVCLFIRGGTPARSQSQMGTQILPDKVDGGTPSKTGRGTPPGQDLDRGTPSTSGLDEGTPQDLDWGTLRQHWMGYHPWSGLDGCTPPPPPPGMDDTWTGYMPWLAVYRRKTYFLFWAFSVDPG